MTELNRYDLALILSTLNADLKTRRAMIDTMGNQKLEPSISLIEQLETMIELNQKVQHVLAEMNQEPQVYNNEGEIVDGVAYPKPPRMRVHVPKKDEMTFSRDDLKHRDAKKMDNAVAEMRMAKAGQNHVYTQNPANPATDQCHLCGRVISHPIHEKGLAEAVVLLLNKAMRSPERD